MDLGLTGWVRNHSTGEVEVVAEGPPSRLRELEKWCRHGPPSARVDSVSSEWSSATGEFNSFGVTF